MAAREGGQHCSRIPKRGQIGEIILSQYKLNVKCCEDVAGQIAGADLCTGRWYGVAAVCDELTRSEKWFHIKPSKSDS